MEQDIRWLQRYANYHKACQRLVSVTESGIRVEDLANGVYVVRIYSQSFAPSANARGVAVLQKFVKE